MKSTRKKCSQDKRVVYLKREIIFQCTNTRSVSVAEKSLSVVTDTKLTMISDASLG